ncbi:ECF transporter S component [Marasmitruncus massiliensis]|uniref:ECF transporter S component n=1 Tax=Marasmitruncus massiliensis TaxID=1944642 RepID=UPI000C7D04C8|nr:ECF transporter S component [Marasmitruncus massiliensis]
MEVITNKQTSTRRVNVRNLVKIALLASSATLLMLFEIPLWFAPSFYEIDLSEVAVLIGAFAMGPLAGVMIEAIKIILNLLINGTLTAGVGEFANFLFGCSFIVPAALIYRSKKSVKTAVAGMAAGTILMAAIGALVNAYVLLPVYAGAFGMPLSALVEMGSKVNAGITDMRSFILLAVVPFNLLKGVMTAVVTLLLYKRVSPLLHK